MPNERAVQPKGAVRNRWFTDAGFRAWMKRGLPCWIRSTGRVRIQNPGTRLAETQHQYEIWKDTNTP